MRVVAMQSFKNGIMKTYGEGELTEDKTPDIEPFKRMGRHNPCIKLDSGKYVWGFECWWGEKERFDKQYKEHIKEIIEVEPDNIQPIKEIQSSQ